MRFFVVISTVIVAGVLLVFTVLEPGKKHSAKQQMSAMLESIGDIVLQESDSNKTYTAQEKRAAALETMGSLRNKSFGNAIVQIERQMQERRKGNGGPIDMSALTDHLSKIEAIEKGIQATLPKRKNFIETPFGRVKADRRRSFAHQALKKHGSLTRARRVSVELAFPAKHFPDEINQKNSKPIARDIGEHECKLILAAFASRCEFGSYRFQRLGMKHGEDIIKFLLSLKYVEKQNFGEVTKLSENEMLSLVKDQEHLLTDRNANYKVDNPAEMASLRLKLYREAGSRCEIHRTQFGNCSLVDMIITADTRSRSLDASFVKSWIVLAHLEKAQ